MFNEAPLPFITLFAGANPLKAIKTLAKQNPVILNAIDSSGQTLLHAAVLACNDDVVQWLIQQRVNINANIIDSSGQTLLHAAAQSGYVEIVRLLIHQKVNINAKDKQGSTPLHLSARNASKNLNCHYNVVECLLKNGAQQLPDAEGKTPFHEVTEHDIARLLHKYQGDFNAVDKQGHSPFYYALGVGTFLIEFFLSKGAYLVQEQDWLRLFEEKQDDEVKELIFLAACRQGYKGIVKRLLRFYPISRDSNWSTPYLYAAAGDQIPLAEWLLKNGYAKPDEKTKYGYTAFLTAAKNGQILFAQWLLANGYAKPDEKNDFGDTAFLIATQYDQIPFAIFLLENNYVNVDEEIFINVEEGINRQKRHFVSELYLFILAEYCCRKKNLNYLTVIINKFLQDDAASQDPLIKILITYINNSCTDHDFMFALQIAKIAAKLNAHQVGEEAKKIIERAFQDLIDKTSKTSDSSTELRSIESLIEEFESLYLPSIAPLIKEFASFDKPRALLVNAHLCLRRGKLEDAYDIFNTLALPGIETSIKESASFEIADLILNGYISLGNESGIDMDDSTEIKREDDEAARAQKIELKQSLLITRAIQAYEYVVPFANTKEGSRLLDRVHNMLMGIDSVGETTWSPAAISRAMARIDVVEPKVKQLLLYRCFCDKVFATHKSILENPNSSQETKQEASLAIAELYMNSRIGWIKGFIPISQANNDLFERAQLARHPLITRAIQAYEYVIPYKGTEAGGRLLSQLHRIFKDGEKGKKWTPEVIEQFGQYYGTEAKFSEYVWQKARVERLDDSEKRQKISPEVSISSFSL